MLKKIYVAGLLVLASCNLYSQVNPKDTDFRSPMDITLFLSGTFGELRNNHFHSGIDIRTQQREGFNIYAIDEGYVSRIKISPWGYGLALYITHPSGYVSVYAHLREFNKEISEYIKKEQYKIRSFSIDKYIDDGVLPVKKGDIVGKSGNSGTSGGPHLHFEIRDEATQHPMNPLAFGINIPDKTPPVIQSIKIYPGFPSSTINGRSREVSRDVVPAGRNYVLASKDTLRLSGWVYFGIRGFDRQENTPNQNGFYGVELLVNSELIYSHALDRFSFDETRYLNSHIDYEEFIRRKRRYEKSYVAPNNKLSIYTDVKNRGMYYFGEDKLYHISYKAKDFAGNVSELKFVVQGVKPDEPLLRDTNIIADAKQIFCYNEMNIYKTDDFEIYLQGHCIYDSLYFKYSKRNRNDNRYFSSIHSVHDRFTPVHKEYLLRIKPANYPANLTDKLLIARVSGSSHNALGGSFVDGFVETRLREFGEFVVMIDTVPPEIKPQSLHTNKKVSTGNKIRLQITDNLSGIKDYNAYANGNWIMMEYIPQTKMIEYTVDEHFPMGEVLLEVKVSDERGNIAEYAVTLQR